MANIHPHHGSLYRAQRWGNCRSVHDTNNGFDPVLFGYLRLQFQVIQMDGVPLHSRIYCCYPLCSSSVIIQPIPTHGSSHRVAQRVGGPPVVNGRTTDGAAKPRFVRICYEKIFHGKCETKYLWCPPNL